MATGDEGVAGGVGPHAHSASQSYTQWHLSAPVTDRDTKAQSRRGLPQGLSGEEATCRTGDVGLIPGSGRSPGGGPGNPLQYSCLENPMDRGAWWLQSMGFHKESDTTEETERACTEDLTD